MEIVKALFMKKKKNGLKVRASQGPRVWGNKETWPFTFREQGNKWKIKLGTRTGTKACF